MATDAAMRGLSSETETSDSYFSVAMRHAVRVPGVRIPREAFLRRSLARHCSEEQITRALIETPAAAGLSLALIETIAGQSIAFETAKVTALSAAAGIPGGLAMIGTVPGDVAQNLAHMFRIAQKLAYLYGWPDFFDEDGDEPDDATQGALMLFVGVMFGANAAVEGVRALSRAIAQQVGRELPKKALTKGAIHPIVKVVARHLGLKMTKDIFAKGAVKVVPLLGAALSGGLTFSTFYPMARRLNKHLAGLVLTGPDLGPVTA